MLGKENDAVVTDSESFKYKVKIIGKTPAASSRKNIEIAVPLKYLSNFWRTLKISLINCEINLIVHCHQVTSLKIQEVQEHSTPDNTKILEQLKSGF